MKVSILVRLQESRFKPTSFRSPRLFSAYLTAILAIWSGLGTPAMAQDSPIQESAYISGKVTFMDGNPVSGFQVSAGNWSGTAPRGTDWTTDDGDYLIELTGLTETFNDIWVDAIDGNSPALYTADRIEGLTVAPGSQSTGIDIRLQKIGASYVRGKVSDVKGVPIANTMITVGSVAHSFPAQIAYTHADGSYDLEVENLNSIVEDVYLTFDGPRPYGLQFYEHESSVQHSARLTIGPGHEVTNVDAVQVRTGSAYLSGRVKNQNGRGMVGVRVGAGDLAGTIFGDDMTSTDGRFVVELPDYREPHGDMYLQVYPPEGYKGWYEGGISLQPGEILTDLDAVLELKQGVAHISGKVTDMDDNPVSGFQVSAGNWDGTVEQGTDWTADDGTYHIELVDLTDTFENIWVDAIDGRNPIVFFGDRVDSLTVGPGSELSGIDIRLRQVGFAYISGTVRDESGNPLGGLEVAIGDQNGSPAFDLVKTAADGTYQLRVSSLHIPSSTIFIKFRAPAGYVDQYYNGKSGQEAADAMFVQSGDMITGIDAVLQPSTETLISGKVTDEFANPIRGVRVTVSDAGGTIDTQSATTSANGTYQITLSGLVGDPNDIRIAFDWVDGYPTQWYDKKYVAASADLLTAGPGSVLTGIDAKLPRTAYIGGKVTDSAGNPLADAAVIVSSRDQSYKLPTVYTPPNGTYQIAVKDLDATRNDVVVRFYGARGYGQQFYPSGQDIAEAEALTIGPGYHLEHIDAVLSPPSSFSDCELLSTLADQYEKMGNQDGDTDWRIRFDGDQAILTSVEAAQTGWQVGEVFWKSIRSGAVSGTCDMELLDVAGRSYPARIELNGSRLKSSEVAAGVVSNTETWQPANTPAVVSGTVTAADGGPLANVTVRAVAITGPLGPESITDSNGSYALQVNPLDVPDEGAAFRFSASGFIDRFYPTAERIADAKLISLHPGDRADYVDVWLEADTGGVAGVNAPDLGGHGVLVENRGPVLDSGGDANADSPPGGDPGDVVDGPTADGPPGGDPGDVVDGPTADGPPGGDPGDVVDGPTADSPPGGDTGDVIDGPTADGPPGDDAGDVIDGPTADGPPGDDAGDGGDGSATDAPANTTEAVIQSISLSAPTEGIASFFYDVTINGLAEPGDQLVIALPGTKPTKWVLHRKLPVGEEVARLRFPNEPGDYELRVESRSHPVEIKFSQPLHVKKPDAQLDAPSTAKAGDNIVVTCVGECSPNANIVVVPSGAPDNEQGPHGFIALGDSEVTIKLKKKRTGAYEIRYVSRFNPRVVYATRPLTIE